MFNISKKMHMHKPDLNEIKNIIFDLGNVILNLDFNASIKAFQKLGLDKDVLNRKQAYADPAFYQLEVGEISPSVFRKRVRQILKNQTATDQEIDDAWYGMIRDIPSGRVRTLQRLREDYRIFLFSNTNTIHIGRLLPEFKKEHGLDFSSLFEKTFYSHEIHARKPDMQAFQKVIDLSKVNPSETLFVDDLERNVVAARETGLKAFWLKEGMEMSQLF